MDDFKKEIQKLSVDEFKPGEVTPWEYHGQYDATLAQRCGGCFRCGGFRCGGCFGGSCFGGGCFGGSCFGGGFQCFSCF
jgi:heterocycloanthracin/sonorensin family bacteriocin